jgi:hypothetical protein
MAANVLAGVSTAAVLLVANRVLAELLVGPPTRERPFPVPCRS